MKTSFNFFLAPSPLFIDITVHVSFVRYNFVVFKEHGFLYITNIGLEQAQWHFTLVNHELCHTAVGKILRNSPLPSNLIFFRNLYQQQNCIADWEMNQLMLT